MMQASSYTETDRTKSKWVAKVYQDFVKEMGRSRTTLRGLFYYALQRTVSDYPICGGFVGEIRITRPYHENDGEKLAKWTKKARSLGFIPADSILEEMPGEHTIFPHKFFLESGNCDLPHIEVWLSKSAAGPLLYSVCERHGIVLVLVQGRPSQDTIADLFRRHNSPTTILCLSDLSQREAFFSQELAKDIERYRPEASSLKVDVQRIALLPEQIQQLKIPMIRAPKAKENKDEFKKYLAPFSLDPKNIGEIDALEVYYPGGIACFLDEILMHQKAGRQLGRKVL
ncbi:MAG: hypothetical protein A4E49_01179 [Methanosaeta sp. PtaU1.Bin112]|nr:MAG: hypothetical protein A4E49_01179 [Methanosaeta sp. PtaU1.Bin112]